MLSAFLVRMAMVGSTLAVVCSIGWSVPPTEAPEPLKSDPEASVQRAASRLAEPPPQPAHSPSLRRYKEEAAAPDLIDLNGATKRDLERLPGIGPVLAARIIEYRTAEGRFHDVEQLRRVKGIGKKKFEQIRSHLRIMQPGARKPAEQPA